MSDEERPALPIDGCNEEFDLDLPPATGQEYLRRVIQEARGCPRVVVADIDPKSYMHKQTLNISGESGAMKAPAGFTASLQWQKRQAADFSAVRQKMVHWKARLKAAKIEKPDSLPHRGDVEAWCRLSFGRLKASQQRNSEIAARAHPSPSVNPQTNHQVTAEDGASQGAAVDGQETINNGRSPPLLSIVGFMSQPTVIRVLEYHVNWFEATGFSKEQGEWLYALLVCLEKPLDPEACSLLRQLARNCSVLRATLDSADHPFLAPLNLFICLVAHYFDQKDLADDG